MAPFDSVLLIGFGGPTKGCCRKFEECPGEAFCYVHGIVGERSGGDERIREVAHHYEMFGGFSPYSFFTQKQAGALEYALEKAGVSLRVYVGFRYWTPYVQETLAEMGRKGHKRALGIILAPHRAKVSWEAYQREVRSGREALGGAAPEVEYLEASWCDHPGFLEANAERIRQAVQELGSERFSQARLIFSAHAIPVSMARTSPYEEEFARTANGVAKVLGKNSHAIAYQSSAGTAPGTWLEPDITDVIQGASRDGAKDVVVSSVGFICDHVEVLFDLDIEARDAASKCGVGFFRAGTVGTHPRFVQMLCDLVAERVNGKKA
ncbi:MAG: ferrochelatase [Nitrospinota bacterium]|nr:ferrochelatase [Nitrospinota bacterium]